MLSGADIVEADMEYLYNDGEFWHFMAPETFATNMSFLADLLGDASLWIKPQDVCIVMLWNGQPLSIAPPNFAILRVRDTEPGIKGDTVSGATKPAILETGASIRVLLFVNVGDLLKVDT